MVHCPFRKVKRRAVFRVWSLCRVGLDKVLSSQNMGTAGTHVNRVFTRVNAERTDTNETTNKPCSRADFVVYP